MVEKTTTGWRSSLQMRNRLCCGARVQSWTHLVALAQTGLVADRLGRSSILIDLNASYTETAVARVTDDCPLFVDIAPAEPEPHTPDMFAEAAE